MYCRYGRFCINGFFWSFLPHQSLITSHYTKKWTIGQVITSYYKGGTLWSVLPICLCSIRLRIPIYYNPLITSTVPIFSIIIFLYRCLYHIKMLKNIQRNRVPTSWNQCCWIGIRIRIKNEETDPGGKNMRIPVLLIHSPSPYSSFSLSSLIILPLIHTIPFPPYFSSPVLIHP